MSAAHLTNEEQAAINVLTILAQRCLDKGGIYKDFAEVQGVYKSISIIENSLNERRKTTRKTRKDSARNLKQRVKGNMLNLWNNYH